MARHSKTLPTRKRDVRLNYDSFLTTCSFQLIYGKLYTFFPVKWVFFTAVSIFELGSLVCGVSPNSNALIVGRAIAGLGSAGINAGYIMCVKSSHLNNNSGLRSILRTQHPGQLAAPSPPASLRRIIQRHVRHCNGDRTADGWCFYNAFDLEMVFLRQLALRGHYARSHRHFLRIFTQAKARNFFIKGEVTAVRYPRYSRLDRGY